MNHESRNRPKSETRFVNPNGKTSTAFKNYSDLLQKTREEQARNISQGGPKEIASALLKLRQVEAGECWTEKDSRHATRLLRDDRSKVFTYSDFASIPKMRLARQGHGAHGYSTRDFRSGQFEGFEHIDLYSHGWYWDAWFSETDSGLLVALDTVENPLPGNHNLGGYAYLVNNDADDEDYLLAHAESGLTFTYTPKKSGKLEISAIVKCAVANRFRDPGNEWGNSNSRINQRTELTFGYAYSDSRYGRTFSNLTTAAYSGNGSADTIWPSSPIAESLPGTDHMVTGRPFGLVEKDKPIDFFVGVRVTLDAFLDDVSLQFWERAWWQLEALYVRVVD